MLFKFIYVFVCSCSRSRTRKPSLHLFHHITNMKKNKQVKVCLNCSVMTNDLTVKLQTPAGLACWQIQMSIKNICIQCLSERNDHGPNIRSCLYISDKTLDSRSHLSIDTIRFMMRVQTNFMLLFSKARYGRNRLLIIP